MPEAILTISSYRSACSASCNKESVRQRQHGAQHKYTPWPCRHRFHVPVVGEKETTRLACRPGKIGVYTPRQRQQSSGIAQVASLDDSGRVRRALTAVSGLRLQPLFRWSRSERTTATDSAWTPGNRCDRSQSVSRCFDYVLRCLASLQTASLR